jgi:hypothetical protein
MGMKIEIHRVDDWEAAYVDGVAAIQDHAMTLESFLNDRIKDGPMTIDSIVYKYHEDDVIARYAQRHGRLPPTLADFVQLEVARLADRVAEAKDHLAAEQEALRKAEAEYEALKARLVKS